MKKATIDWVRSSAAPLVAAWAVLLLHGLATEAATIDGIQSDKARYAPGEAVQFELDLGGTVAGSQEVVVRYRYLSEVVDEQTIPVSSASLSWSWSPPTDDYRGYLAEVEVVDNSVVQDRGTFAVDVSSDWAKFPRYGFLSKYDQGADVSGVMENLNRYHINGLQFYDWGNKHHDPLSGTASNPAVRWYDIAKRTNYFSTVDGYITEAHEHNMTAMAYNLAYGALDDAGAADDNVLDAWYLYTDEYHLNKDFHDLPSDWLSDIYLLDPANTEWQDYVAQKMAEAFGALPFDGWHIDQLGDRGTVYDYADGQPGEEVDLESRLGPFVDAMKASPSLSGKKMLMNAVNQYGQTGIAQSGVDFLYSEVWDPNEHFNNLADVIQTNNELSNGQLNSVVAAYMNYDLADNPGLFNTPSVLLADAVIFAFGGAHLELGEHMLSKQYFPDDNLQMSSALQTQLTGYYDFLVGYQNLLRDGGQFGDNPLSSSNTAVNMWPAQQGSVSMVNKTVGEREVFHLINFTDATHMNWRDTDGVQPEPSLLTGINLRFYSQKRLNKLWAASPDGAGGAPENLAFSQLPNGTVVLTLPSLKYWSMIVAEGDAPSGSDYSEGDAYAGTWANGSNGGEGFGPWQLRSVSTPGGYAGFWRPDDGSEANGIDNTGAPDPGSGSVWSSFANKGSGVDKATAFRTFDTPLDGAGDSFAVTLEHGDVYGRVGLTLRSSNTVTGPDDYDLDAALQLYFEGGDTTYTLVDGSGVEFDTGVGFTRFGISAEVMLTGGGSYDLVIWRYDEENDLTPQEFVFSGRSLAGDGPLISFALFQYDTASTSDVQGDVFFNHLWYNAVEPLPGDFDNNGAVDEADLQQWQDDFGLNGNSDADGDGDTDIADLLLWQQHFGEGGAAASGFVIVPEPSRVNLLGLASLIWLGSRGIKWYPGASQSLTELPAETQASTRF